MSWRRWVVIVCASLSACDAGKVDKPRIGESYESPPVKAKGSQSKESERETAHQTTPPSTPVMPVPSEDLLTRLRRMKSVVITSDAQDVEHWRLAERVVNERLLVGLHKEEIERKLGPGAACDAAWSCDEGYRSEDWYYEIGRLPQNYVGGVPMLLIDFDENGICIASRVLHGQ